MFWKKKILSRMMEFQVKFCHHSELRLWRTGMLFSTKYKCLKSNFRISWMCRYCFHDLKVYFWCLISGLKFDKACLNTLYIQVILKLNQEEKRLSNKSLISWKIWTAWKAPISNVFLNVAIFSLKRTRVDINLKYSVFIC